MALSMASELANLLSAVEGRAHHLIEAAPARTDLPSAAEAMLDSIDRLRVLHTKLIAFGGDRPVVLGTIDVNELISSLGHELQQMQLGLEFRWEPRADLPSINACPDAIRDALLFTASSLLRVERGATRLTFTVERSFASDIPAIVIELHLEWVDVADSRKREGMDKHTFALDFEAARQLIESHQGKLMMSHLPGKSVHALVSLPVAIPAESNADAKAQATATTPADTIYATKPGTEEPEDYLAISHHFGGALVLESDPALRAVLARELKASGRAVFACADGASAHTFLQATPDRFELLIVDDAHELDEHTPLARAIRQHTPDLKICLLTPSPATAPEAWPDIHCLQKPFGVHELRRTLASILAVR
jgi:CheY-like chemotaxis protein